VKEQQNQAAAQNLSLQTTMPRRQKANANGKRSSCSGTYSVRADLKSAPAVCPYPALADIGKGLPSLGGPFTSSSCTPGFWFCLLNAGSAATVEDRRVGLIDRGHHHRVNIDMRRPACRHHDRIRNILRLQRVVMF